MKCYSKDNEDDSMQLFTAFSAAGYRITRYVVCTLIVVLILSVLSFNIDISLL